jgi:hypothetical protein
MTEIGDEIEVTDDIVSSTATTSGRDELPSCVSWKQTEFRVFVTVELPIALKQAAIKVDNRQMRIAPNSGGKAIVQGQWSRSVANHTVTTDAEENTVHIDLLKGVAKEAWPSLFRVRPSSTTMQQQELRRVITPAAGRDGVELTLVVGELVVLLNMVDNTWAKGSIFGGSDDVGLFRLDDTDPIDAADAEAAKADALLRIAENRMAQSQEKQDALRKFYEKSFVAGAPTTAGGLAAASPSGDWCDQDEIDFSTAYYHAIVCNERAWSDGPQPPRGEMSGWLSKLAEKGVGGSVGASVKGFGKKLLGKVSSQSIEGWQRRFCVIDASQQSLVYGVLHNEGHMQAQRWELKGSIFLGGGCQVSVLAFQMSGRPGCLRLRPRVGAKLKDYTLAADTLAVSKQWADGLVAAGAQLVDSSDVSALEPRGVYGSVLYKLGGGALREWQPRFVCVEADGLLSYYEIKLRSNNRKEFYLRGTLQLPFCNVSKVDGDVKTVPAKHRYQLVLKQQGGTKDKEYVWCGERHDVRDKWYQLAQEYGAVDLVHPNLVKPLLRTMPTLPSAKRPTPRADAPPPKPAPAAAAPAKPPLRTAASTPARPQTTSSVAIPSATVPTAAAAVPAAAVPAATPTAAVAPTPTARPPRRHCRDLCLPHRVRQCRRRDAPSQCQRPLRACAEIGTVDFARRTADCGRTATSRRPPPATAAATTTPMLRLLTTTTNHRRARRRRRAKSWRRARPSWRRARRHWRRAKRLRRRMRSTLAVSIVRCLQTPSRRWSEARAAATQRRASSHERAVERGYSQADIARSASKARCTNDAHKDTGGSTGLPAPAPVAKTPAPAPPPAPAPATCMRMVAMQ